MTIHATSAGRGTVDLGLLNAQRAFVPSPQPPAPQRNGHDTPELREAFDDFVGQTFFGELLKQMRATVHKSEFFHGGMGEDVFQTQLDQIMVEQLSEKSAKTFSQPMYDLLMARRP